MHNPAQSYFSHLSFDYFDIFILAWLVVGVLRGRKNGMSQEVFPAAKWICIVVIAGLYYRFFGDFLRQNLGLGAVQSNVMGYLVIAAIMQFAFSGLKTAFGEKLVSGNYFGRCEYYFGMISGCIRFACMAIMVMALAHARLYSKEELAAVEKMQKQNFEDIRFPTFGSIQQSFLVESFSGQLVQKNMPRLLITTTAAENASRPARVSKSQSEIDEVLGPPPKR